MIFIKRTDSPSQTNKYYLKAGKGGYNKAAEINEITHSCLPNCCGLSFMEDGLKVKNKLTMTSTIIYV